MGPFLKAYKTNEREGFFTLEWFHSTKKLTNEELPRCNSFFNLLRNINHLEKDYSDFGNLVQSDLSRVQALAKLGLEKVPPTGAEVYAYLQTIWGNEHMQSFADFLKWYNNEDVVKTLETMQKVSEIYHDNGIDMLKLGFTLTKLAKICLHKSTDSRFYPFAETDEVLLKKMQEDMVGGPPRVSTR